MVAETPRVAAAPTRGSAVSETPPERSQKSGRSTTLCLRLRTRCAAVSPLSRRAPISSPHVRLRCFSWWFFWQVERDSSSTASASVVAHAFAQIDSGVRVAVVNKSYNDTSPTTVTVVVSGGTDLGDATVGWLSPGPGGIASTSGLRWGSALGNLTFDNTPNGAPVGRFLPATVERAPDGSYSLEVPPSSVAVLEIAPVAVQSSRSVAGHTAGVKVA